MAGGERTAPSNSTMLGWRSRHDAHLLLELIEHLGGGGVLAFARHLVAAIVASRAHARDAVAVPAARVRRVLRLGRGRADRHPSPALFLQGIFLPREGRRRSEHLHRNLRVIGPHRDVDASEGSLTDALLQANLLERNQAVFCPSDDACDDNPPCFSDSPAWVANRRRRTTPSVASLNSALRVAAERKRSCCASARRVVPLDNTPDLGASSRSGLRRRHRSLELRQRPEDHRPEETCGGDADVPPPSTARRSTMPLRCALIFAGTGCAPPTAPARNDAPATFASSEPHPGSTNTLSAPERWPTHSN